MTSRFASPFRILAMALVISGAAESTATAAGFVNANPMTTGRAYHTASALPDGKVLVAGGFNNFYLSSAELYDPATASWSSAGALSTLRYNHTASLLPNGMLLVAGGRNAGGFLASTELYNPATATWTAGGALIMVRAFHTATLLQNGKVLVAGGSNGVPVNSAELYDPATGTWSVTGSLATPRANHTATLLTDGKVLVAGGSQTGTAELYDPATGTWTPAAPMSSVRMTHTATLLPDGKVLVAAGSSQTGALATAEIYDPATGVWTATGSLSAARRLHSATLLPNGNVFIAGGFDGNNFLVTTAIYQPSTGIWTSAPPMPAARAAHTATLLPNGRTLIAGGSNTSYLASVQLYDPSSAGIWSPAAPMVANRTQHTATMLPNGKLLVAGGRTGLGSTEEALLGTAEIYDPSGSGTWSSTGNMSVVRTDHTATLLPNGKVLVAGGWNGVNGVVTPLASATLYDPTSGTWTSTGTMPVARHGHTATLLGSGKVLLAGGYGFPGGDLYGRLSTAVLYDPSTGTWSATGAMRSRRALHTATLLAGGKVLLAGGHNYENRSSELYDPTTGTWSPTSGEMFNHLYPRIGHVAVLLPGGKVLVAAGEDGNDALAQTELYDPVAGTWSLTGNTTAGGVLPSATLLANGKVLLAGGLFSTSYSHSSLYDPATGIWQSGPAMAMERGRHTSTLLPNGKLLIVGGETNRSYPNRVAGAELYDSVLGHSDLWRPLLDPSPGPVTSGERLLLTGSRFQGISGASGGNVQDSSSNHPVVQFRAIDSGRTIFLRSSDWSATGLSAMMPADFIRGWAMVTVFVNGVPSASSVQRVAASATLASLELAAGILEPAFSSGITDYSAVVPGITSSVTVTPTSLDPAAAIRVRINGGPLNAVPSGSATPPLLLTSDENPVEVEVTSIDGGVKTYHLLVTKGYRAIRVKEGETLFADGFAPALDFDIQRVGQSSEKYLEISNNGNVDFTLGAITINGTNAAEFAAGELAGLTLPPGGSATFAITFSPSSASVFNAAVHIESDADGVNDAFDIVLTGEAFIPQIVTDATGSMATPRREHTAIRLANGKVLVAAGRDVGTGLVSAELYDPAAGTWSPTGDLAAPRYAHTAVLLSNGKVLVCGGSPQLSGAVGITSAELYDPATGTWSATGPLANARYAHTATVLPDGKVLIAGGRNLGFSPVAAAELYDPATGVWSPAGDLVVARFYHSATRLADGRVLVAGGSNSFTGSELADAEIFDPSTGLWTATGSLAGRRRSHTATLLTDGSVLVAGGNLLTSALDTSERYLPASGTWTSAGKMAGPAMWHTATALADGSVFVAGGIHLSQGQDLTQRYDPATGLWEETGYLINRRGFHRATVLENGTLLLSGGSDGFSAFAAAEIYDPAGGIVGPPEEIFNDWASDAGLVGPAAALDAIPFNDGVPNLLKYAFNMNAGGPDVSVLATGGNSGLPQIAVDQSGAEPVLRVEFLRRKGSGLIYTPQRSDTLDGFLPMTGNLIVTSIDAQWERVTIEETALPTPAPSGFARVQVRLP